MKNAGEKKMERTLLNLTNNEEGFILSIEGGHHARNRLESLGIRPGKKIRKMSSQFFKGPVVISIDGREIALGHGLARKIIIR